MKKSKFLTPAESKKLLYQLKPVTKTSADTRTKGWVSISKPRPVKGKSALPSRPKASPYPPPSQKQLNYAKQLGLDPKEFHKVSPNDRYWSIYLSEPQYRDKRTPKELKIADDRIRRNGLTIKPYVLRGKKYKRY